MSQQNLMVAEFAPDMPDLATATNIAVNVLPVTPQSYGPFPQLVGYSTNAMDGQCVGAISVQSSHLTIHTTEFSGTTDKLYLLGETGTLFEDVSSLTRSYNVPIGANWEFVLYSQTIIATDFSSPLQSYVLTSSTHFTDLFTGPAWATSTAYSTLGQQVIANGNRYSLVVAGTSASSGTGPSGTGAGISDGTAEWDYQSGPPPLARFMCTPKNFLFVAYTSDPVGGLGIQRVWWSVAGDPTSWPAPGSNPAIAGMSDFNDFEGNFGPIAGVVDSLANADVAIFFKHAVWRGEFAGPPVVFDFFPTENVRGCPAPNSIVPLGAIVYYLGEDGFYAFDGAESTPIGANKFDQWFFANLKPGLEEMIIGAPNVPQKTIMWAFPSKSTPDNKCDTILAYRWDIQRASYINLGSATIEWMLRALLFNATSAGGLGDALTLGAFDNTHKYGTFTGSNMAAQVATQTVQLTPGRRSYFQSARPLVDLTSGTPTIAVSGRVNLYDTETFGPDIAPDVSGECPQRNDARYHDVLIKIPAASAWTHIEGVDATFVSGGFR